MTDRWGNDLLLADKDAVDPHLTYAIFNQDSQDATNQAMLINQPVSLGRQRNADMVLHRSGGDGANDQVADAGSSSSSSIPPDATSLIFAEPGRPQPVAQDDGTIPPMHPDALGNWKADVWPVPGYYSLNPRDVSRGQGAGSYDSVRIDRQGNKTTHTGVDIHAPVGAPVVASSSGVIVRADGNDNKGYGNQIVIDNGNGIFTEYAHLGVQITKDKTGKTIVTFQDKNGKDIQLKVVDRVEAGDQIGIVGRSGDVPKDADSHLHYEIRYGSQAAPTVDGHVVDPARHLPRYPLRRSMSSE